MPLPPPPPQPPQGSPSHHHHHHLFKKPSSFADAVLSALSFLVLVLNAPPKTRGVRSPKMSSYLPSAAANNNPSPRSIFATPQCLADWLRPRLAADSFRSWGVKPGTKNVHNLWLEIAEGESSLDDGSEPPVRTVEVAVVRIIRRDGKVLVESHQQLSDGSVRYRNRPLSEKMKPGETVEAAVYRAIKEELGSQLKDYQPLIDDTVRIVPGTYVKKVEERASASYPGLPARYVLHVVDAEVKGLPEEEFWTEEGNEYGDLEDEKGVVDLAVSCKKHYWKWVDERDHHMV